MLSSPRSGAAHIFATRGPIINVHVGYHDEKWTCQSDSPPSYTEQSFRALLDTGSDGTSIDGMLAQSVGAKATERAIIHGLDGNRFAPGTRIRIVIPLAEVVFCDRAFIHDFRATGSPWDLVLGRSFLHHCRMQVDGPSERYWLEWVD